MAPRPVHFRYKMALPLRYGIRRASAVRAGNLFPVRRVDRDDSAGFGYDVSDGEMLARDGAVFVAILHPQVEIDDGADVAAFHTWKRGGVGGSGYGSIAPEAYRIPGRVAVAPMGKGRRSSVRHRVRLFSTPGKDRPRTSVDSAAQDIAIPFWIYLA
jgi:hypothetical protein